MSYSIAKPFTQSWIQALMLAADKPVTRTIKPSLEWIDKISLNRAGTERMQAARELWDFGQENYLQGVLSILPTGQPQWEFPDDDRFLFERKEACIIASFEDWTEHLGIQPGTFALSAEVTSSDWTTLVRTEAVRKQKPFNSSAFVSANTLHPPCRASWDGAAWSVAFDEIEWLVVKFEDVVKTKRPPIESLEEQLMFSLAEAEAKLLPKHAGKCPTGEREQPWRDCVGELAGLHAQVLGKSSDYQTWTQRVWNCVWPVVYREQNVLRGQADVDTLRPEIAECITSAPKLTVWMFVFAKLVCQTQTGMGLGICADYRD